MEKRDSVGEERRRGCDLLVRAVAWCEGNVKGRRGEEKREKRERGEFSEREKKKGEEAREREKKGREKENKERTGLGPVQYFLNRAAARSCCAVARIFNFSIFL